MVYRVFLAECKDGSVVVTTELVLKLVLVLESKLGLLELLVLVIYTWVLRVFCGVTFLLMVTFDASFSLDKVTGRIKIPIPIPGAQREVSLPFSSVATLKGVVIKTYRRHYPNLHKVDI